MLKFKYHKKICRSFDLVAIQGVSRRLFVCNLLLLFLSVLPLRAQWQDQSVVLKPGWNAVYLHVDASHVGLDDLIVDLANPISEVWLWRPPSTSLQYPY